MTPKRQRPGSANPRAAKNTADTTPDSHPNTAQAQRARLLARLRGGAVTTIQARRELDVMHPAMRVLELRKLGHRIITHWTLEATDVGRLHRVARYVLVRGAT